MTKLRRPNFSLVFRLDSAKLVLEQNYSVVKAAAAKRAITNYIVGYFSPIRRLHQHNKMSPPNRAEEQYWKTIKPRTVLLDHYNLRRSHKG